MGERTRKERIVASRLALRERFLARAARPGADVDPRVDPRAEPATLLDTKHPGLPRLPPGQQQTHKWPVLDLGEHPRITPEAFALRVDGAVARPLSLSFEDLLALPQVEEESDFHCVTGWSRLAIPFTGVPLIEVLARAEPLPESRHLLCHAADGYRCSLPLPEALAPEVLLAHRALGAPLTREHGGPLRMITPRLYAWKGAKWITRIEILEEATPGFWERQGYAAVGDPWSEDRYADPDDPPAGAEI